MGMYGKLRRLSESRLKELIENPDQVLPFLLPAKEPEVESPEEYDLEKSWHVIHFLLTGCPEEGTPPASNAIFGGTSIGGDAGFGPARYLRVADVKAVSDYLKTVSADVLLSRFEPGKLNANGIYFGTWTDNPDDRRWIRDKYVGLVKHYAEAARAGQAMILLIH
jgi:hypothetical protein